LNVALISSNILKKGIADFIKIAHEVKQSGRPIRFLLIGPPTRDLHLLRPWPDNIEFRGYSASPVEAIAQADIVLSLSHFTESFGRTVMEAMAAARAVITYDRGTPAVLVK
ncbi:glycosyltransferase family 4 protein, partial [Sulfitobacter donghicola]